MSWGDGPEQIGAHTLALDLVHQPLLVPTCVVRVLMMTETSSITVKVRG